LPVQLLWLALCPRPGAAGRCVHGLCRPGM